eukprot:TRINITY_DN2625_c0_g1_i1.p1 TRINITY_DN2625_c0_g1~~TRINITY_DN2625_c0_g1_i1.p1  ORF type:complete len:292 (-),score=79.67 TRINITY_DN2625_c0_g1_i1:55-930(-)
MVSKLSQEEKAPVIRLIQLGDRIPQTLMALLASFLGEFLQCQIVLGESIQLMISTSNMESVDKPFSLLSDPQGSKLFDAQYGSDEKQSKEVSAKLPKIRARTSLTGEVQLYAKDIHGFLRAICPSGPNEAMFALSAFDLFEKLEENGFTLGGFNRKSNTSVVSLLRFHRSSSESGCFKDFEAGGMADPVWIDNCLKTVSHESLHLLSLRHCALYDCLMNGFANLQEFGTRSNQLCPVCLHKVAICVPDFSPERHYASQRKLYETMAETFPAMNDLWVSKVCWIESRFAQVE